MRSLIAELLTPKYIETPINHMTPDEVEAMAEKMALSAMETITFKHGTKMSDELTELYHKSIVRATDYFNSRDPENLPYRQPETPVQ